MNPTKPDPGVEVRILIVEDEALIAEELQDRLSSFGFQIVGVADNAEEALEITRETSPDLVLMDIRLKGKMDGIEAANRIRQHSDIPIVYVTAHSDRSTFLRAKASAPFGYVLKPLQDRDLLITIELALHRHALDGQLRESEARYAATLASIGDGVITATHESRVQYLNRIAEQLTGWTQEEAEGLPIESVLQLLGPGDRQPVPHPATLAMETASAIRLMEPLLLVRRDGDVIPVGDSAAPIINANGDVSGAVVAFHDARPRLEAEARLGEVREQLRHAQKMEAIGRLAGGVAHDFNNLLTIVLGHAEALASRRDLDDDVRAVGADITDAGRRAAGLTQQLLAISRRQFLRLQVLDLNVLLVAFERMLRRVLDDSVSLALELDPKPAFVNADRGQIEQVLLNLVINARDAMPEGGALVIETRVIPVPTGAPGSPEERTLPPGVLLSVRDTGHGMDAATRERIFEPFFTTKPADRGTGLGLSMVYGIIQQSGGTISVASDVGVGTVFRIWLPSAEERPAARPLPAGRTRMPRGGETILLVEDEENVRRVVESAIRRAGFHVVTAKSTEEALVVLQTRGSSIDLMLSDVVMPGPHGVAFAQKAVEVRPGLRIAFMSGHSGETLLDQGAPAGEYLFLPKPFTPGELVSLVRAALDRPEGAGPADRSGPADRLGDPAKRDEE